MASEYYYVLLFRVLKVLFQYLDIYVQSKESGRKQCGTFRYVSSIGLKDPQHALRGKKAVVVTS
ncbi:hypothetical protein D3C85_1002970 [compost metagenome]